MIPSRYTPANTTATYTESGSIEVTHDGVTMNVPDDMANSDRVALDAAGITIAAYTPPAASPCPPLRQPRTLSRTRSQTQPKRPPALTGKRRT